MSIHLGEFNKMAVDHLAPEIVNKKSLCGLTLKCVPWVFSDPGDHYLYSHPPSFFKVRH